MTNQPTPADELRAAAEKLRTLATAATPGPWRDHDTHLGQYGYAATVLSGEGNDTDLRAWLPSMSQTPWDETRNAWPDAAYIAAMHPSVGTELAKLLEAQLWIAENEPGSFGTVTDKIALGIARIINGTEETTA
ncbi:hypothetical protein [Streptomyces sp. NBC_00847]|uniref:hypothetical protein n=1 Tax=Streptomyces sp. NBC_00847 TaxID=2975850 RepID=UPI00225E6536|nr:hypothetical protein [Streptomyces sp. NBC_00847]MCX4885914.1 hypothetical protein [Streptomyces sp. NBC_00847]